MTTPVDNTSAKAIRRRMAVHHTAVVGLSLIADMVERYAGEINHYPGSNAASERVYAIAKRLRKEVDHHFAHYDRIDKSP